MWRKLMQWLLRIRGPHKEAVQPHPDLTGDRGERRHVEKLMEAQQTGFNP